MLRAPPVLLLLSVICGLVLPPGLRAQEPGGLSAAPQKGFRLEQNYPNPANPSTNIPFYLEETLFAGGESQVVSIRIIDMFGRTVAIPRALAHPRGRDVPILNLRYTEPGRKVAFWDGRDMRGRRVAAAPYFCVLQVGDRTAYSRIIVTAPRRRSRLFPFFRRRSD